MQYEYLYVKELKVGKTQAGREFKLVVSQSGEAWRFFNGEKPEIGHAYTIGYDLSEQGYKNCKQLIPLAKVFLAEALKEVASKNDINKNISISLGYAKDLWIGGKINANELFELSDKLYDYISTKTDQEYDKLNNNGIPSPKEVKV